GYRVVLNGVDEVDRLRDVAKDVLQRVVGLERHAVARPGDLPDAVGEHATRFGGIEVALRILEVAFALPDAGHLGDLLLQSHPREEVIDPRGDRSVRVFVERLLRGAGAEAGERQRESSSRRDRAAGAAAVPWNVGMRQEIPPSGRPGSGDDTDIINEWGVVTNPRRGLPSSRALSCGFAVANCNC